MGQSSHEIVCPLCGGGGKVVLVVSLAVAKPSSPSRRVNPPRKKPPHEWLAVEDYGRKRWLSRKVIDHILSMRGQFSASEVRSYLGRSKLHKTESHDGLVVTTSAYLRALVREGKLVRIRKNCYMVNRHD